MAQRPSRSVPRTFLFTDLRDYAAFVERAGDTAASQLLRTYRTLVRRAVSREQGAEIKTEGDSFYVVFGSSVSAIRCALAIQRAAARRRRKGLTIGIGIHTGEATPFDQQYVGSAVNIAARMAAAAAAGEILISDTVRSLTRTALPLSFEDRGPLSFKGIAEPIRAFSLRVGEPAGTSTAPPPTKPIEAIRHGDLDGAVRMARTVSSGASAEERCEALAAFSIAAAAHGDVEDALRRCEQLLSLGLRGPDRSWIRAAYGLRSWLYFLARQPGEALAELDRAFERPGTTLTACLPLLLAVTLGGSAQHITKLRHMATTSSDPALAAACGSAADAIEGRTEPSASRQPVEHVAGPLLGALVELQLCARLHGEFPRELRPRITRAGADRLAELIMGATAQ